MKSISLSSYGNNILQSKKKKRTTQILVNISSKTHLLARRPQREKAESRDSDCRTAWTCLGWVDSELEPWNPLPIPSPETRESTGGWRTAQRGSRRSGVMQILRRALRGWVDALPGNEVDSLLGLVTFELCTRSVLVMDRLVRSGMNFHQRRTHPHSYRGEQKKSWPAPFGPIFSGTARSGCATCLRKSRWKKRKERKKRWGSEEQTSAARRRQWEALYSSVSVPCLLRQIVNTLPLNMMYH